MKNKGSKEERDMFNFLMTNEDFSQWVLFPSEDRNTYWKKWIELNPEFEEVVNEARALVLNMRFKEDFLSQDRLDKMLENIISEEGEGIKDTARKHSVFKRVLALAACIGVVGLLGFSYFEEISMIFQMGKGEPLLAFKEVANPKGQKSRIKLSDGSVVFLNGESTIRFPEKFANDLREVELRGEAFFEVSEDVKKPFIVKAGEVATQVLGTSFNLSAFEGELVAISLVNGKLRVVSELIDPKDALLTAGEMISVEPGTGTYDKKTFDIEYVTSWKDGTLVFKEESFSGFVEKIERWYGVKVLVEKEPDEQWRLNGKFQNPSLETVLMNVQYTYEMNYKIEGKDVTLY